MKNKILNLVYQITIVGLSMLFGSVYADTINPWFFTVGSGVAYNSLSQVKFKQVSFRDVTLLKKGGTTDTGFLKLAFGRAFALNNDLSLAPGLDYYYFPTSTFWVNTQLQNRYDGFPQPITFGDNKVKVSAQAAMLSADIQWHAYKKWILAANAGAGFSFNHTEARQQAHLINSNFIFWNQPFAGSSHTQLAWQAGAGIAYQFTPHLQAGLEYTYLNEGSVDAGRGMYLQPDQNITANLIRSLFMAKVTLNF